MTFRMRCSQPRRPLAWLSLCVLAALTGVVVPAEVSSLVNTTYGPVSGKSMTVFNGAFAGAVNVWHAIPYAKPPIGQLRFADPQLPDPWEGVFDAAVDVGYVCPQDYNPTVQDRDEFIDIPNMAHQDEDCLVLHIYAPYDTSRGPYPVMVWYHGGGLNVGAANEYPGYFLATHDVVIVTVNYRLNNFGFAYTGDEVVPGNAGLKDQQLSLVWVQQEIAAFGGDPTRVTISGQSSGASSTSWHMFSPNSQGLFHQVIAESGNEFFGIQSSKNDPTSSIIAMADDFGCTIENTAAMVSCLRLRPWRMIKNFHCYSRNTTLPCTGFGPVMDSPGGFFPGWPRNLREKGEVAKVPLLSGICRDDANLFALGQHGFNPDGMSREDFSQNLKAIARSMNRYQPQELQDVLYRQLDGVYAPWPHVHDEMANMLAYNELLTDLSFGADWDTQVKMHQHVAPVYAYVFAYRRENATIAEWLGVPHMEEIPFVWGHTLLQINENAHNDSHILVAMDYTVNDIKMTVYFQQLYANYIKYGNPSPQPVKHPFDEGSTTWSPFTYEAMNYHWVTSTPEVLQQYRQKQYMLFEYLMPSTSGVYSEGSSVIVPA